MPKVSVIVPVHNTEKYLRDCFASVAGQTLRDIEIVLVENASSDCSLVLCHELAQRDSRVKVISLEKGDLSLARNAGIECSSGEYLAFVDSDDTIEPRMCEDMLALAEKESLDIVFCDFVKKYDYRAPRYEFVADGSVYVADAKELLKMNFKDQMPHSACTMLCRRRLFDKVRFPVGRFFEDVATTWKLLLASDRAGHISTPYYNYYRHGGSIVHTADFRIHHGHILADVERLEYINSSDEYTEQEKMELGKKPVTLFYRHFRKMVRLANTREQLDMCLYYRDWALSLPRGYRLKFKYSMIEKLVRDNWGLFCLLHRGKIRL